MASDLSSGCTEVIEIFDEKEEGEISLEDVSSSEEGQLNDACNSKRRAVGQCPSCLSTKHCASWCRVPTRRSRSKGSIKKDAVQEKENCHHTKDSGYPGSKHSASTLQENNNDLIPISSDSDMEIVGLADNVKPSLALPQAKTTKVRKRRRKRRSKNRSTNVVENVPVSDPPSNLNAPECSLVPKRDTLILKDNHLPRTHHRESNSPHKLSASSLTRSRIVKSPLRRHRSPFGRTRSPVSRKSPLRRPRSPSRRSPPLSPNRSPTRRQTRSSLSPSNPPADMHQDVNKLLKKVRHLTAGTHSTNRNSRKHRGRGPSLKDKLNNMMKNNDAGDIASNDTTGATNNEKKLVENFDEEDDLALLRKMALETKPKRNEKDSKEATEVREETQPENNDTGDDDVEDLELRMIALRSAMLKKHQDRMQRGMVPGKTRKPIALARTSAESPFSQSFLDSIPIPGEDNEEGLKTLLRIPTLVLSENTNPEDMELDSEVELEKEKGSEPYSPTDDLSRQINIDSELLGIQPSDVSFITPSSQVTVLSNSSNLHTSEGEKIGILETGASYLPNNETSDNCIDVISSQSTYYSDANVLPSSQSPTSSLYSPVDETGPLESNFSSPSNDNLAAIPYSPSQSIDTPQIHLSPQDPFSNSDANPIPDTPYSPTDTPMYDIEINNPPSSPLLNTPPFQNSEPLSKFSDEEPRDKNSKKWRRWKHQRALIKIQLVPNLPKDIDTPLDNNVAGTPSSLNSEISETSSMKGEVGSAFNSSENSPESTMIIVDELPETDLDGSPLVPVSREIQDIEIHIPAAIPQAMRKITQEPLYLQGVPDVTKDANKIPTLVNRSLVPASILKSNKNLQQPLPPKKIEAYLEPAFKSAEMQPVQISTETTNTNRIFKPIKLAPAIKKPQVKIVTAAAFNCSSNDNSVLEEQGEYENIKSMQGTSKNEAGNLLEDLQNERTIQAPSKTWEANDLVQSENCMRIVQPTKTPLSTNSESLINFTQFRGKHNDTLRISSRKSTEKVEENLDTKKKTPRRSRRSNRNRSKHAEKTERDDKSIEARNTTVNPSKAAIPDGLALTDTSPLRKQTLLEDSVPKKRNARDKLKKPVPEKSKRQERRERRGGHKYDKVSNNSKNTDTNKIDDCRMPTKKQQQKNTEVPEETERTSQNCSNPGEHGPNSISQNHTMDVGNLNNNNNPYQLQEASNIHENTANGRRSDSLSSNIASQRSSELNKTDVNIPNSAICCNVETEPVENTQHAEDLASNDTVGKRVEANKRRRSSLDEDEEELRAILLASLAKRSKPSDPINGSSKTTALANLSHTLGDTSTESVKGLPSTPDAKVPVSLVYSSSSEATPASLDRSHSTLSNTSDKNSSLETLPQAKTSDPVIGQNINPDKTTNDRNLVPSIPPLKRRSISASAKAPLKKIAKKVPISASTKVVNNAKKYQNTLVQKKLNLQKVAMITNAQKTMSRANIHNNKVIDGSRPRSMITQPLSDTQRFVINLASDSESENESETLNRNLGEPVNTNKTSQKPILAIPMSDFEKSVDLFLKDVRKKQETAAATKPSSIVTTVIQKPASPVTSVHRKSPVLSTTPLAVRHLSVSKQEEYRRLKQQILEREKLKLHRVLVNNMSPLSPSSKSSGTPPGPLSPASPIVSPTTSKQTRNISSSSQSPIITVARESSSRNVSIQSNVKSIVSPVTVRVSPVVSKTNAMMSAVSNLSIQIPNETTNVNSACKKSSHSYIPASTSQTRLVTAVKTTQDTLNTKDPKNSAISMKDQLSLKNVQVQLQQGKDGRRVSLGETLNLCIKAASITKDKEAEARESPLIKASVNLDSNRRDDNAKDSGKTIEAVDISEKCVNSVDSSASTLIISREDNNAQNSTLGSSSTSTIIISRNDDVNSCKPESVISDSSKGNSSISKSSLIGQRKLRNNTETWEKIRGDVRKELDAISALPSSEQKSYLATVEQNLVKKRYAILDDLSEISGNLRQLEMEREVQSNMASEVKKLQEQLRLAEERLQAQRNHVNKMVPNISAAYEKLNNGRRECVKMTRICLGLGCLVIGANYKIPAAGVQLLNNRLKQVAGCTRQLSSKKISVTGNTDGVMSKKNLPNEASSSIEKSLENPLSESTPNTIDENSTQEGEDSETIGSVTVIEDHTNSNTVFAASIEAERTNIADEETMKLQETTTTILAESLPHDPPQLTSTPNSSEESSGVVTKNVDDPLICISNFVLDTPEAGSSRKKDSLEQQRRFVQPYKSVLTHLTVPRVTFFSECEKYAVAESIPDWLLRRHLEMVSCLHK